METVFFIADLDSRVNQQIAIGLLRELHRHGPWHLHMFDFQWPSAASRARTLRAVLGRVRPNAVVTHVGNLGPESLRTLLGLSVPWIAVGCDYLPRLPIPAVVPDNEAVGTMAAEYFLDRGFEHFALANFQGTLKLERCEAFRARLARARKTPDEFAIRDRHGRDRWPRTASVDWSDTALVRWLRRLPKPCALLAYSDHPAAHIVGVCGRHGIGVPDEVSVLGVDDDVLFCHTVYPNLASIHVPNERMGREAARLILNWRPGRRLVHVPPRTVVERGSVRGPPVGDPLVDRAVAYARSHVRDGVHASDLQRLTGLTPQMLVYRFRRAIGRTPMEEILRHRVALARQLLAETDEPVREIARQCGYRGATQFYVTFRDKTGLSPSAYRAEFGAFEEPSGPR